jgi:hypothetical protein
VYHDEFGLLPDRPGIVMWAQHLTHAAQQTSGGIEREGRYEIHEG